MASAWLFTIPMAALLGGVAYEVSTWFGSGRSVGSLVIATLAAAGAYGLWTLAQRNNITPADLDRTHVPPEEEANVLTEPEPVAA
jgi:hypothetical protein